MLKACKKPNLCPAMVVEKGKMPISVDDPDFVTALARGLDIISAFGPKTEALTLTDAARICGLSRGTARRLLLTLEALGYVKLDGRDFRLGAKTMSLGYAYLSSMPLWRAAQPIMREVVDQLDQSCALGVLDKGDVVYVARIPPSHLSFLPAQPGTRMPAHVNAMGLVLLADLPPHELDAYFRATEFPKLTKYTMSTEQEVRDAIEQVRIDGYAISDRQVQSSIRSIAVPIRSHAGRVEVALNASAAETHASKADLRTKFLPVLTKAAEQLVHFL